MSIDLVALEAAADAVRGCTACPLHETRGHAVPGEGGGSGVGAPERFTGIMLVGEAPGRNEDETGRPFCGAAGKNLDLGLAAAGIGRDDVFVTSIVKCRPPKNRDPKPAEKAACRPHLEAQLDALGPKVLVALGRHGLSSLVERPPKAFSEVRGRFVEGPGGLPVFCSLHPAAIIYRQAWREDYLADWAWFGEWVRSGNLAQRGKA
ncbi:MAG: uracil-DNA glycosylase [Thermoplasmatota archaeon]